MEANKVDNQTDPENNTDQLESLVDTDTNKNIKKIKCLRCDSYILQPMSCVYKELEQSIQIPAFRQKKDIVSNAANIELESTNRFWLAHDMYTFENIGFTNTVDNKKYLICADCEMGPVGIQNLDNPTEFLVCLNRVKHV